MCDVVPPMPRCQPCVAEEQEELREKLELTPDHPLLMTRLEQLEEDHLLSVQAMGELEEDRQRTLTAGEDMRPLSDEQTRRFGLLNVRELQARRYLPRVAGQVNFTTWDVEPLLSDTWAFNPSVAVRRRLAANPSVPAEVLSVLARDYDRDVLDGVMSNPARDWVCFFRVVVNPHAKGGMAEIRCLLQATSLPSAPGEDPAVDAAMTVVMDEMTVEEKVRLISFLRA